MKDKEIEELKTALRGFVEYKNGMVDLFRLQRLRKKCVDAEALLRRISKNTRGEYHE